MHGRELGRSVAVADCLWARGRFALFVVFHGPYSHYLPHGFGKLRLDDTRDTRRFSHQDLRSTIDYIRIFAMRKVVLAKNWGATYAEALIHVSRGHLRVCIE